MSRSKYPPYPSSNMDYSIVESARQQLQKPNTQICLYCREQAKRGQAIKHKSDCPARNDKE